MGLTMRDLVARETRAKFGVRTAYAATACVIVLAAAAAWSNSRWQDDAARRMIDAQVRINLVNELESTLTDAETGQRGYLVTGDPAFLEPYRSALGARSRPEVFGRPGLGALQRQLGAALASDADGLARAARIDALVAAKLAEMDRVLRLYDADRRDEAVALVRDARGKRYMDLLREEMTSLRHRLKSELSVAETTRRDAYRRAYVSAALITAVALASLAVLMLVNRKAMARLAATEQRLGRLSESDLIGIVFGDLHGGLGVANDAFLRIIGRSRAAFDEGKVRWDTITPPEWLEVDRYHIEQALQTGKPQRYEKEYARPDGTRVPVTVGFMFADDGRDNLVAFVLDMTAQKRQEARLRAQEAQLQRESRKKDEFIAVLAHELRNPLAPLQAGLDLMRLGSMPSHAFERTRAIMHRQLSHLVRLIDDLLDISRINAGKLELNVEDVDVRDVVQAALEASDAHIVGAGHALDVDLPEGGVRIRADAVRMTQILTNLLVNAAKYTPPGGRIALSVRARHAHAVFVVTDNGIGIEPELQDRIFEMFTQSDKARELRQGGIGLGLPLTKKLVGLHGGTLAVQSAPGAGSTFTVEIPLAAGAAGAAGADAAARAAGNAAGCAEGRAARRILVVDDNVDAANTLAELFKLSGHDVHVAHDGNAAIRTAQACEPDVIFLDIGLPDMSGHDVARALRGTSRFRATCIVALTGWGTDTDRARSRESGFDLHLTKPAPVDTIRQLLPGLL